ncbi:MAG TPA: FtsX-like permease family protein, partial [Spirochaetia bacterium]|nr:FtsX-like permease family protein [Spirochaetia bacterium]
GFRKREVLWMFTFEGLFVGLAGSVVGGLFGILLDWYLVAIGIPLGGKGESISASAGMAFGDTLRGTWNVGTIIFAVIFGLVIALVAGIIPARRAAKMTATAALRFA